MKSVGVRVLAAVIALQLALGGVGVAGIGIATVDGDTEAERLATDSSSDSFGELEDADGAGVPSEGSPPPVTDPATGAPPGAVTPPAEAPTGAIPAPRPGTYRYTQTSKSTTEYPSTTHSSERTEEVERRIERVSESPTEIVDRRHTPNRQTSSGSDGSSSEERSYDERVWRTDASFLRTEVSHSVAVAADGTRKESSSECDWEPDRQQVAFPLRVGLEWEWDSSCSSSSETGSGTTTNKGRARVVGTRDLDIGGRSVATFIIDSTAVEDTQGTHRPEGGSESRFDIHTDQRATTFFAPSFGLTVRIEAEHKTKMTFHSNAPGYQESTQTQTATSELLNVDPT